MIFEAMIVDDEAPARVELINQLERTGRVTVVNEAVCLQEGIAKMQSQRIDVVFIDHNIAGSGTMLLPAALKDMDYTPALIYMTAYSDVNDEPFGVDPHVDELAVDLELGVIRADGPLAYLTKPVDSDKLDAVIALLDSIYARKVEVDY